MRKPNGNHDVVKRTLDIIFSVLALAVLSPWLALCALLIALDGGPIFFIHERVGLRGKKFRMLKFRTMVPGAEKLQTDVLVEHNGCGGYGVDGKYCDDRITKIGRILRFLNIDELPQLINVLTGDMSIVGPRPVPEIESLLYADKRETVLSVKPGITGLWQIKRRLGTTYDERVQMDCEYVETNSLALDFWILVQTPIRMLRSDYNSNTKPLPPVEVFAEEPRMEIRAEMRKEPSIKVGKLMPSGADGGDGRD